jgi:tetratricopeptide (TPR) repeat protein
MPESSNPIGNSLERARIAPLLARATELLRAGRPADAIVPLDEAVRLEPSNALLQHDLGLACLEVGRMEDAASALRRAVSVDPTYADAHFRLGIALEQLGDVAGAVAAYDRATELAPALTEAWFRAGALVSTLGHRDEAIGCFRRAAETGAKTRYGRLGKARELLLEDRDAEAEKVLRKALAVDPENALAHELLGGLLSELGRFDEARACFEQAIAIAPMLAGSYYDLVRCRRVTSEECAGESGLLRKMQSAFATPGIDSSARHRLHLAIGKIADDLGNYALAMEHFDAADAVRREQNAFDAKAFETEVDRLIARCTPEWVAKSAEDGRAEATPVLIIGMPRSGTTLVEQIVSSHPDVRGAGELNYWNEQGSEWHHPSRTKATEATFLREASKAYLDLLRRMYPKSKRVSDKMPFNFLWAGLIHRAFPRATIIHCRRSAIDTALSIHQTHFHPGFAFPTGGVELVEYYRSYRRLTDHWRKVLPADRFLEVEYEELASAPEPTIRRVIEACDLPWNQACLSPENNLRAVRTPSKWQTRQPIYRHSVARWRRYEAWLGPLAALIDMDTRADAGNPTP